MAEPVQNPNLMSRAAMEAMARTKSNSGPLVSEIFTKINNAKDKTKKIEVLKQNDSEAMRMLMKGAFDPKIEWDLPEGTPPYIANEAPAGTEHSNLLVEAKRLWHFVKGADPSLNKPRKEQMFIQMLEGLHASDAEVLIAVKDDKLNNTYKGLTANLVKEAFGWDDNFSKPEQK